MRWPLPHNAWRVRHAALSLTHNARRTEPDTQKPAADKTTANDKEERKLLFIIVFINFLIADFSYSVISDNMISIVFSGPNVPTSIQIS